MTTALHKRLASLEARTEPDDRRTEVHISDEARAAICANPDDAAAFERLIAGDQSAIPDLSTDALQIISRAGHDALEKQSS